MTLPQHVPRLLVRDSHGDVSVPMTTSVPCSLPRVTAPIRARFAPSPTGYLHLGSARTALFNWMFVRHHQGLGHDAQFLLRIEDTDLERSQPELIDVIFESLAWLGLDTDGDPIFQSRRHDAHVAAVRQLIESGHAYRCDCTQEAARSRSEQAGGAGYDGYCRDREVTGDGNHVVRFRTPDAGDTAFDDVVRGAMSFENSALEDFVLQRSDGSPVFLLANTVDDADMGVTHVIRGEDLLNVTPKTLLVREALGHHAPLTLAHLPLIVNAQRKKLSKRRDDVSLDHYRERGFLPEAMVNYLALLGWGPPDEVEVRPIPELVELFELDRVGESSALFDVKKLEAVNGEHIRMLDAAEFVERARPWLEAEPWADCIDEDQLAAIAPHIQVRARVLSDVPALVDFLFLEDSPEDAASWTKAIADNDVAGTLLDGALDAFGSFDDEAWTAEALHVATEALAVQNGLKLGKAQAPIRVAVTGRMVGPPLFESLEVLGRDQTLRRLRLARARM